MTKILVEHNLHHPFNPEKVTGGTERYCYQLFQVLKSRGMDVKMVVPLDTEERFLGPDIFRLSSVSKQFNVDRDQKMNHRKWWTAMDELARDYDVVITSSEISSVSFFDCVNLPSKQIHINHFAFLCTGTQMGFRYLVASQFIRQSGGVVLSSGQVPSDTADRIWVMKANVIRGTYSKHYDSLGPVDLPLHDGLMDVNILPYDLQPLTDIGAKRVVAVGRAESGKRMPLAAKVLKELGNLGYECEMFITPYGNETSKVIDILEGSRVKLKTGVPHVDIMSSLAMTGILLFTSKDETNGLVAFEAAASGCRVLYETPEPAHFLNPAGAGVRFKGPSPKRVVEAVEAIPYPDYDERLRQRRWYEDNYSDSSVCGRILRWL